MKSWRPTMPNRPLVPVAVFSLAVLILLESAGWILRPQIPTNLEHLIGERSTWQATVVGPPEPVPRGAKVVVAVEEAKVLLTTPFLPTWQTGDRIEFEARLKRPTSYKNPGAFDYRRFLARQGIVLTGFVSDAAAVNVVKQGADVIKGAGGGGAVPLIDRLIGRFIDEGRRRISASIFRKVSPPAAGFLAALFIGDRSGISEELWGQFRDTGTAHLIAISGQHIAIVAVCFYLILLWLLKRSTRLILLFSVRRLAALFALIPVWLYTFLAGAPPSALRAAVMVTLAAIALFSNRDVDPPSALAAAAILLGVLDPAAPFSASFQLSFLAVLGILIFRPGPGTLPQIPPQAPDGPRWFRKYLLLPFFMTVGATLLTAPLVAYRFNIFPLSGLWNNFWAIPACSLILIATPVLLLVGLDSAADFLTQVFLKGIEGASHHAFSFSVFPTGGETLLIYGLVALAALIFHRKIGGRTVAVIGGFLLVTLLATSLPVHSLIPSKRLEVTFLDVGQGDAALVIAPSGKSMLIDGGGFLIPGQGPPLFDVGERVLLPYLRRRGIRRIDRVFLSHPHPDHYGGLNAVLAQMPVGEIWWNGQTFPDSTFDEFLEKVDSHESRILHAGDRFDWEGTTLEVLYPESIQSHRSINDNSLVMRLTFGEVSFLFTGDIEGEGERFLADLQGSGGLPPRSIVTTVIKIPHHASRTSSSIPFIDKVRPRFAVASFGEGNPFHFPHPDILERYERRGVKVFRTDRDGAVTFLTDGKTITTQTAASDFR